MTVGYDSPCKLKKYFAKIFIFKFLTSNTKFMATTRWSARYTKDSPLT